MQHARLFALLFLIIFSVSEINAQQALQREWTIFRKGVDDYLAGNYEAAEKNFNLVITKLPNNNLLTANYLMLAKTKYKIGDYNASNADCDDFLKLFPASSYRDDILYLKGNNYFRMKIFQQAISNWLLAAEISTSKILRDRALGHAENTVRYRLNDRELSNFKTQTSNSYVKHFLLYHLAERYYDKGNAPSALISLEELLADKNPKLPYTEKASQLYELLKNKKNNAIRIAALLPLTGEHEQYGKEMLDGLNMAVDEFNRLPGADIEIVTADYETRLISAVKQFKDLAADPSIKAIFGPVENDISAACAALADYEGIPMISPTASENELTQLSSKTFQLATPVDIIAESLVEQTQDSLKFHRVATLAPIDDYFLSMTHAFINKHLEDGGEIVTEQWYYPGDKDFSRQFKQLKRIGLKLEFQDSVLIADSTLTPSEIDSMYSAFMEHEIDSLNEMNSKIDSADIPVTTIDAIFMPIYKEDIGLIAPQYAYYNIQAQILGNSDWYDPEALKRNKNYLEGLIFISDGYMNEENWDYRQFRNNFRGKYKRTPEQFDLIGFDSFNFIINAISNSQNSFSRADFYQTLLNAPKYNGIFRHFDFQNDRFNHSTRILKYWHGLIVPNK
jgi:branched-chain amino acid transport system substrate-binding protein